MKKLTLAVSGLAAAIAAGVASPAFATSNYIVDGTTWTLRVDNGFGFEQLGSGGSGDTPPYAAYAGDGMYPQLEDPAITGNYLSFDCASPETATIEDDGDQLVECNDPTPLLGGDLTWDADLKIFSADYRGLVGRLTYVVTNEGDSPLTLNLRYFVNTEECNSGSSGEGNVATSSGDLVASEEDSWLLCLNNNEALEGIVWGDRWATSVTDTGEIPNPTESDRYHVYNDGFVLDPGQTSTSVFFLYSEGATDHGATFGSTDAAAISNMTTYFDVDAIRSSRLWEGLTTVDNWSVPEASAEVPTLPDTGVDATALVLASVALAGLGTVLIVRRRAKA